MKTEQKFIPDLKGCGKIAKIYTHSSIQKPIDEFGKSHLLLRNVSEYYSAFNYAMFGPFDSNNPDCFKKECIGKGQVCFLFD
jgi:hypothetical protein